ncbi:MAG TPA: RNA-binding cell elongation regulator Jag/EloR [Acidimicrobiales bacterium]|nr:RNA-binding cell elongation regulator Jag/EloR [Acidimicrobiales bacterium]
MEWVETTGRTVEEAKDAALDRLGVDERDAEFDVLEEARSGLFGRVRQEARVRARVRPDQPRPRVDRRDRRRRKGSPSDQAPDSAEAASATPAGGDRATGRAPAAPPRTVDDDMDQGEALDPQTVGEQARAFLDGLAEAFDVDGRAEFELVDDLTVEARLVGDDLGMLVGPKGQTLAAVQDLTRAVAQNGPRRGMRLRVDVGGYQQRRRDALTRFTQDVADQVRQTGDAVALEPMPAADRKVVHDSVNTVEGVTSRSEGEDPRRRVVIAPE